MDFRLRWSGVGVGDAAYDAILGAARARFAQGAYRDVTIRSIAADAGYSPSLVMKLMGSKENLFWLSVPGAITDDLEEGRELLPQDELGRELVRRIFVRRRLGSGDPHAITPLLIQSAPEPDQIRDETRERFLNSMAAFIGDATEDRRHAKVVLSIVFGIAAWVHILEAYDDSDQDDAVTVFGELVQTVIDRCDGPRRPLPDVMIGIPPVVRGTRQEH